MRCSTAALRALLDFSLDGGLEPLGPGLITDGLRRHPPPEVALHRVHVRADARAALVAGQALGEPVDVERSRGEIGLDGAQGMRDPSPSRVEVFCEPNA